MKAVDPLWRGVMESEQRAFKGGGARFEPYDTLLARITPCLENGKIAQYIPAEDSVGPAFGSTEFIVIRGKDGLTDNSFAYYLTKWHEFRQFAVSQMTGSSGRQRVPVGSLSSFYVPVPPLPEQRAIAHILGTLDDKIELNRRMNENTGGHGSNRVQKLVRQLRSRYRQRACRWQTPFPKPFNPAQKSAGQY